MIGSKNKSQDYFYKEFINRTAQLKNLEKINTKQFIKDIIEEDNIIGRQFLYKNSQIAYEELLIEKNKRIISNLNEQISFLYPPNERKDEKIIGIRFFKNDFRRFQDGYFTLVKIEENKYEILEKCNIDIKDCEENSFFMENLDCDDIIKSVIFKKYINNSDFIFGLSFIEILGFIYSAKNNLKAKCIICEPFIPNPSHEESLKESFECEPKKNELYLRPILYLNHVSILLVIFTEKYGRKNILIDMSHFHKEHFEKDNIFFPTEMRQNLIIIPKNPIQLGETCGLWFLGQVTYIMKNGMHAINELLEKTAEYILKIIDEITVSLKLSKFLKISNKNNSEIKNESDYVFKNFRLSKNVVFNPFLNIENFFKLPKLNCVLNKNILLKYGKKFEDARNSIIKLQINLNHYKIISDVKLPIEDEDIENLKEEFIKAKTLFEEFFEIEYKYYYKNKDNLELKMKQKEADLITIFDFIDEIFKSFSDDCCIYDYEELKKIYVEYYNNSYNRYLENYYN